MTTKITTQRDLLDLVNRVECTGCDHVADRVDLDGVEVPLPSELKTVAAAEASGHFESYRTCRRYLDDDWKETPPRFVIVAQEPLLGAPHSDLDDAAYVRDGGLLDPGRWEYVVDAALVEALELAR